MHISQKYFHDRTVLALLSLNIFIILAVTVLILLRLSAGDEGSYIVSYRSNLGLNAFSAGSAIHFLYFIVLGWFIFLLHTYISMRMYRIRKHFSVVILSFATLLLGLIGIITNALFVLS